MTKQRADLTFKENLARGRHGWVRLTPAYSVKVVHQILDDHPHIQAVLDPFSGTGTTGLVATERGLTCDLYDINPFLIWLAQVKTDNYPHSTLDAVRQSAHQIVAAAQSISDATDLWQPPISHIERWWQPEHLQVLKKIFHHLSYPCEDLLLVAFCRLVIDYSNAAFNHQSMSFKANGKIANNEQIYARWLDHVEHVLMGANQQLGGQVQATLCDSRYISTHTVPDAVITSPPYVNRMSYIRELRPYMFWLGYLEQARDAGELDWQAIGGTWGIATSRLNQWEPPPANIPIPKLLSVVNEISQTSAVLGQYVHKYFVDMATHFAQLAEVLPPHAQVFYIVGNSKFYDTLVPAEHYYAQLLSAYGFTDVKIERIRKRNSKKELYEYLVSAQKGVIKL